MRGGRDSKYLFYRLFKKTQHVIIFFFVYSVGQQNVVKRVAEMSHLKMLRAGYNLKFLIYFDNISTRLKEQVFFFFNIF